eukprot:m.340595 g.340595  ORF g.340595 m.340595 type:complete len:82 (-) comp19402_c0_seq1:223-468(-)
MTTYSCYAVGNVDADEQSTLVKSPIRYLSEIFWDIYMPIFIWLDPTFSIHGIENTRQNQQQKCARKHFKNLVKYGESPSAR